MSWLEKPVQHSKKLTKLSCATSVPLALFVVKNTTKKANSTTAPYNGVMSAVRK